MAKSLERLYGDVSSINDGLVELSNRYAINLKEQAYGVTSQEISNVDGSGNPLALSIIALENDMKGKILRYSKVVLTFPDGSYPLVIPNDIGNQPADSYENDFLVKVGGVGATVYPGITYPVGSLILSLDYEANTVNAAAGTGSSGVTGGNCVQYNSGGKLSETSLPSSGGGNESAKPFTFNPVTGEVESTKFKGDGSGLTNLPTTTPGGSDTQVQFNDGGSFGGDSELTYNKTTDTLTSTYLQGFHKGDNIGNIFNLSAYLTAVDFCMSTDRSKSAHSRSNGAASRVDSSLASTFATFQVPLGYKATHVLVSGSSTSATFDVYSSSYNSGTSTSLTSSPAVGTDTALSTQQTGLKGNYIVIKFTPGSTSRDVYGAKITLALV